MTRHLLLLAALSFLAPILLVDARQQAPAPTAPPGTLRGIVIRDGTTEPIPNVQITAGRGSVGVTLQTAIETLGARGVDPSVIQAALNNVTLPNVAGAANAAQYNAVTDGSGRFVIEGLPPGQYPITARREGYFGPSVSGDSPLAARGSATIISHQTTEVQLTLVPGGAVSGRVLGPAGLPLANASVELLRQTYQNGVPTLQTANTKQTDDRGEYRLFQIAPGQYYVVARPRAVLALRGAAATEEQPFRTFYPDSTDPTRALIITLHAAEELAGINIQLRTATLRKISGRVVSQLPAPTNIPAPATTWITQRGANSTIQLVPRDRGNLVDPSTSFSASTSLASPTNGTFEISNIPPGVYDLYASLPDPKGYGPAAGPGQATQPVAHGRTTVEVRGNDPQGVSVVVHEGVDVPGQVVVDGKRMAVPVRVSLQAADTSAQIAVYNQVGQYRPAINADGSFSIPAVPEATYRVLVTLNATPFQGGRGRGAQAQPAAPQAASLPPGTYVADVRQGGASVYDRGIEVATSQVNPIEVLINTNGATIEGSVTRNGQPAPSGMTVVLIPPDDRRQNPALYKTATSNAQGNFVMNAVPPGQYKLFAWESIPSTAYQNADFMKAFEDRGVTVSVAAGARLSQAVPLISSQPSR